MTDWAGIGAQARAILEDAFDGVAASTAVYTPAGSNVSYTLKCLIGNELARFKREGLRIDEIGALDRNTFRVVFKTADIVSVGLTSGILPTGSLSVDSVPMDFMAGEPFAQQELSPMLGAKDIFTHCWVRQRVEKQSTDTPASGVPSIGFSSWS